MRNFSALLIKPVRWSFFGAAAEKTEASDEEAEGLWPHLWSPKFNLKKKTENYSDLVVLCLKKSKNARNLRQRNGVISVISDGLIGSGSTSRLILVHIMRFE